MWIRFNRRNFKLYMKLFTSCMAYIGSTTHTTIFSRSMPNPFLILRHLRQHRHVSGEKWTLSFDHPLTAS